MVLMSMKKDRMITLLENMKSRLSVSFKVTNKSSYTQHSIKKSQDSVIFIFLFIPTSLVAKALQTFHDALYEFSLTCYTTKNLNFKETLIR